MKNKGKAKKEDHIIFIESYNHFDKLEYSIETNIMTRVHNLN